ncbi:MAG: ribosomal protein L7/L12 [Phycisphaerales bacterium]
MGLGSIFGDSARTGEIERRLGVLEHKVDLILGALGLEVPDDPRRDRIAALLVQGRKIAAIKEFREATGLGLAEAKAAIENGSWASMLDAAG